MSPRLGYVYSIPTYVAREVFEARIGVLEGEVEGEKLVTRHILGQTRRNGDDLAAIKTRLDRVEKKVDGLGRKVDLLDRTVRLANSLPVMVAQTMREARRQVTAARRRGASWS